MTYAKAKLNILLKSNTVSCLLNNNFIVNETNEIIEKIDNYSIFEIISWELEFLNKSYLNIRLQTDNYCNSWKELKDIREESNNIINLLNTHKTFLIDKWEFKIEKLIEDPKKSIEDVEKDIKETPIESKLNIGITSPQRSRNVGITNPSGIANELEIEITGSSGQFNPGEKKKSLRELILAFLKKNGPSSVKQITLGVLNMGLVTQSKSPRMVVNSMLWKLCRDERYRQQDKKGAYYNPVILDNDRWRLKK